MYSVLRNGSIRASFKLSGILFLLSGILFFAFGRHLLADKLNPTTIVAETNLEDIAGKYVSMDIAAVYGSYMLTYTSEEGIKTGNDSYEYIISTPAQDTVMGLYILDTDEDYFKPLLESLFHPHIHALSPNIPKLTIKGTLVKMNSSSIRYFDEALNNLAVPPDNTAYYLIKANVVGSAHISTAIKFSYLSAGIAALGIVILLLSLFGFGQRKVRRYIASHSDPALMQEQLQREFKAALYVKGAFFMPSVIFLQRGITTHVTPSENLFWAYEMNDNSASLTASHKFAMGLRGKKYQLLSLSMPQLQQSIAYIQNAYPWAALGYDLRISKIFDTHANNASDFSDAVSAYRKEKKI